MKFIKMMQLWQALKLNYYCFKMEVASFVLFWIWLRLPELEHFLISSASWVSVCSKFVEMNRIIINPIKYAMWNIHSNDNFSKYFIDNELSFILFHCDFTNNLPLRHNVGGLHFLVLRQSDVTINVSCL